MNNLLLTERSASPSRHSHPTKYIVPVAVLLLLAVMVHDTKVVRIGSQQDVRADKFSAEAYGHKAFPAIQSAIEGSAIEAKVLAAAISEDQTAAAEKYGKPGSVGPIFPVKFSGVAGEFKSGALTVAVNGLPDGLRIRVQTGPAINGTDVRDATGAVSFGSFTNQIEYQDAGSALNNEIKTGVLAAIDREHIGGKKVEVVGVFQLINATNWLVTPVRMAAQ
jgi:predicted lipoprotein